MSKGTKGPRLRLVSHLSVSKSRVFTVILPRFSMFFTAILPCFCRDSVQVTNVKGRKTPVICPKEAHVLF